MAASWNVSGLADATSRLMRGLLEPLLLDAIAHEPRHGYALIRDLERVFGEPPNRNQVYPLLNRLERDGYLRADRTEGRGKTRYALTGKGLELLKDYRLRTPLFRERVAGLWLPDLGPPSPAPAPPPPPRPAGERPLMDQIAVEGEVPEAAQTPARPVAPAPLPAAGPHRLPHVAGAGSQPGCQAELVLRRQPGEERIVVEFLNLEAGCPACQELSRGLVALQQRWFQGPTPS